MKSSLPPPIEIISSPIPSVPYTSKPQFPTPPMEAPVEFPKPIHPSPTRLPDIFTTCPELCDFKPIISFPPIPGLPSDNLLYPSSPIPGLNHFDPNDQIIRPHELGFIPPSEWTPQTVSLQHLCQVFFHRRNGTARRFAYKLYNALRITKAYPQAYEYIGAKWVSPTLMKINSQTFAKLMGIHAIQGGLFHKQGNFSRHGFKYVFKQCAIVDDPSDLADVDDYNIRLLEDSLKRFSRDVEYRGNFDSPDDQLF